VPPGYADPAVIAAGGNPYGTSVTATGEPLSDEIKAAIRFQTQRLVDFAGRIAKTP